MYILCVIGNVVLPLANVCKSSFVDYHPNQLMAGIEAIKMADLGMVGPIALSTLKAIFTMDPYS